MNKTVLSLFAIALVATCAGSASAQCDFNSLAKAKGLKTSMVRAYAGCPSTEHPSINSQTGGGTPACSPVIPKQFEGVGSGYMFDPQKGGCDVQTQAKLEKDCSLLKDNNGDPLGLPSGPCHITYVKSKCKGILQASGGAPINAVDDAGWSLTILTRMTSNDTTNGDVTMIDFPITFAYEDPRNGQIRMQGTIPDYQGVAIPEFVFAVLPTCTSLETLKVTIKDPEGRPFATIGGSTRAATE